LGAKVKNRFKFYGFMMQNKWEAFLCLQIKIDFKKHFSSRKKIKFRKHGNAKYISCL